MTSQSSKEWVVCYSIVSVICERILGNLSDEWMKEAIRDYNKSEAS